MKRIAPGGRSSGNLQPHRGDPQSPISNLFRLRACLSRCLLWGGVFAVFTLTACVSSMPKPPAYTLGTLAPEVTATARTSATPPSTGGTSTGGFETRPDTPTPFAGLTITSNELVRVRTGPGTNNATVGLMPKGSQATAIGKSDTGEWLAIQFAPAPSGVGWVAAQFVAVEGDAALLPVVTNEGLALTPQAGSTVPPSGASPPPLPPQITPTPLPPGAPTSTGGTSTGGTSTGGFETRPDRPDTATGIPIEVGFYADSLEVNSREPCTYLRWIANPAQAVYLDGKSVLGENYRVVCPTAASQTYTLEVVTLEGKRMRLTLTITNASASPAP